MEKRFARLSAYAPQVGCDEEEKEAIWEEMTQVMQGREKIWIGGDLNGHVGEGNKENEKCMGNCGMGFRNEEGERIISFAKAESPAIVNTYFKKGINNLITYSSGQHKTQIDYLILGDYVAKQHRPVVAIVSWVQKEISSMSTEKKIKWWNLKIEEKKEAFYLEMKEHQKKQIEDNWSETSKFMTECAERLLGMTSGKVMVEKENWWWNDEVQEAIKWNKEKKREKYRLGTEESKKEYMCSNYIFSYFIFHSIHSFIACFSTTHCHHFLYANTKNHTNILLRHNTLPFC